MTMEISGKKFVVTGGAGFIGSHLTDALLEQGAARVVVVDNFFLGKDRNLSAAVEHGDRLLVLRDDASDFDVMRAVCDTHSPDVVFNLATKALLYSFFNPAGACRVNLDLALTMAELLRSEAYGQLVHLSSSEVYGTAQQVPMDETHPLLAETTYAAGKAAADLTLASYHRMFGLPITVIRPFNNYGPRQNEGAFAAVIPLTVQRILAGEKPRIEGDGNQTRDFIYVEDTVAGILGIAGEAEAIGEVVNLASGQEVSIIELVQTIADILEWRGGIAHDPVRPADVRRHWADMTLAGTILGRTPLSTSLHDGLSATIAWYRQVLPS